MPRTEPPGGRGKHKGWPVLLIVKKRTLDGKRQAGRVRVCKRPAGGIAEPTQMRSSPWELRGWLAPPD